MTENLRKDFPQKATTTDDSKPKPLTRLEKLEQQRAKISKQISLTKNREKQQERKLDTRRKILVGSTLMTEAEKKPELYDTITRLLDRYLTREDDRKLFPQISAQHRKDKAEEKHKVTA
ncbi:mobilization protein [Nitrospira sp. T9]|uniref:mobilization protein n=1 Tax=unclassified Nitrospira TaxID=2652172 RepID=UPI003F94C8EA